MAAGDRSIHPAARAATLVKVSHGLTQRHSRQGLKRVGILRLNIRLHSSVGILRLNIRLHSSVGIPRHSILRQGRVTRRLRLGRDTPVRRQCRRLAVRVAADSTGRSGFKLIRRSSTARRVAEAARLALLHRAQEEAAVEETQGRREARRR